MGEADDAAAEAAPAEPPPAEEEEAAPWGGDPYELEEYLAGKTDPSFLARFEQALQRAAAATPDVSRHLRLHHAAAAAGLALMYDGADRAVWTRTLYGKDLAVPMNAPPPADGAPPPPLTLGGVPMAWCWETATYEKASEVDAVGAAAYEARKAREREAEERAAYEAKKLTMSKRERKKAEEKEKKDAEAAALAAEEKALADAAAAEEAAKAEALRLADPAVQKEMAYQKELTRTMQMAVEGALDAFLASAHALDSEPKLG